jgi:nucleoside-triphosphatase THEP1
MNILYAGRRSSGKSTFLHDLVPSLDIACGGVIALPFFRNGDKLGMDALDVATGMTVPLARVQGDGIPVGRYRLRRPGIRHARQAVYRGSMTRQLTVVDELGPLELRHAGLMHAARFALRHAPYAVVVVRERLADIVASAMQEDFCMVSSPGELASLLTSLNGRCA